MSSLFPFLTAIRFPQKASLKDCSGSGMTISKVACADKEEQGGSESLKVTGGAGSSQSAEDFC